MTAGDEVGDRIREPHWFAHVPAPIVRVPLRAGNTITSHGRVQRYGWFLRSQIGQRRTELVEDRIHQVAVVADLDLQESREYPRIREVFVHTHYRVVISGERDGRGAVHGGNRKLVPLWDR